ncbi:MAG: glycosyltransferase family 4 protein [Candidatus Magasanikbacteria bacterium]
MPLRLGIDASRANQEQRTGVEKYCFQIIQHLKEEVPANVQVILYSKRPLNFGLEDLPENWESKVLSWPWRLWTQIRLSYEMVASPVDALFIPGHTFPLFHPKKTILTIHDIAAAKFQQSYNLFERYYSLMPAKMSRSLSKIIVPSEFTKKELTEEFSVSREKIHVIPHGFNSDYHQEDQSPSPKQKALNKYDIQKPFLLFIGRLELKKNLPRIIQAFNKIKNGDHSNLSLVLGGKHGYGYKEVKKEIERSKFKQNIKEIGWIDEDFKRDLISQSELLLLPSLYEGFGFPVLEAFSCETPVLASEGTSLEEVGGSAPIYVNPLSVDSIYKGIESALSDRNLIENKVKFGKKRLQEFSWEKCARQTAKVLLS